jgi:hypothetical protein
MVACGGTTKLNGVGMEYSPLLTADENDAIDTVSLLMRLRGYHVEEQCSRCHCVVAVTVSGECLACVALPSTTVPRAYFTVNTRGADGVLRELDPDTLKFAGEIVDLIDLDYVTRASESKPK